jgi:hypothetical protein
MRATLDAAGVVIAELYITGGPAGCGRDAGEHIPRRNEC